MPPDSAQGSKPDDLIDLSDIMDDGPEGASLSNPQDSGDMSFDQELEDLFSDALPDEGPKGAPGKGGDDDILELGDDDLADFGQPDPGKTGQAAPDDLIDLSDLPSLDDEAGASAGEEDLLELTDLVEDGESQGGEDILELTDLEEIPDENAPLAAAADGTGDDALDLDLTDLIEEAPEAAPAVEDGEPDLSDLLASGPVETSAEAAKAQEADSGLDADLELELPDLDFVADEAILEPALDMPGDAEEPAPAEDVEAAEAAEAIATAPEPDATPAEPEAELEEEEEGPIPAFAEEALDMAPEETPEEAPAGEPDAAPGGAAYSAVAAGAAAGIDLAALDAIIEQAGGPPAEEPQPAYAAAIADEEFTAVKDRMAALEERVDALHERFAALPGQDALEALGEKLTAGFQELLRQGLDALRADLPAAPETPDVATAPDLAASLDGFKDELTRLVDAKLDEAREDILARIPQPVPAPEPEALAALVKDALKDEILEEAKALAPDADALAAQAAEIAAAKALEAVPDAALLKREIAQEVAQQVASDLAGVKDAVLAEMKAALPDADDLIGRAKEAALAELRESLPKPPAPPPPVNIDGLMDEVAALSQRVEALGAALALRSTKVDLDAAATRIKMGLLEEIDRSASAAAVKVLREEIQALLDEME